MTLANSQQLQCSAGPVKQWWLQASTTPPSLIPLSGLGDSTVEINIIRLLPPALFFVPAQHSLFDPPSRPHISSSPYIQLSPLRAGPFVFFFFLLFFFFFSSFFLLLLLFYRCPAGPNIERLDTYEMKFQSPAQIRLLALLAATRAALSMPVFTVPHTGGSGGQAVLGPKQPPQQPEKQEQGRKFSCAAPPHITVVVPRPSITVDVSTLAGAGAGPEDTRAEDTRVWGNDEDARGEDARAWDDAEGPRAWDDGDDTVRGDAEDARGFEELRGAYDDDDAEETRGPEELLPAADDSDDDSDDDEEEEDHRAVADFVGRHASAMPPPRDWIAHDPQELVPAVRALNAFFAANAAAGRDDSRGRGRGWLVLGARCVPQLHAGGALASANRVCIGRTTTAFCNPRTWAWEPYSECAAAAECRVVRDYSFDSAVWGLRVGCVRQ